jgi:hypothetical protein
MPFALLGSIWTLIAVTASAADTPHVFLLDAARLEDARAQVAKQPGVCR